MNACICTFVYICIYMYVAYMFVYVLKLFLSKYIHDLVICAKVISKPVYSWLNFHSTELQQIFKSIRQLHGNRTFNFATCD